ncbi:serine/threonine-protein phosphatase 6 regulatory ankyrin repeat subunit C-like isoform X1 [Neocloeon triangulifer]|uniref:serine/threonine-protein phosphatase 6 regulatory ankyrin repeat subunit C-like isoform X1 n=1 Tax=Neocloeon triangulifer TaxID=2078957 RepID=UPI00286F1951|nr:serine/threonine-protein phosphatase 6 regulatory ankyrin repeat subunit C-like isoform X1 [Neocloeon triangulifer]
MKFLKATPHSGWMLFILRSKDLLRKLLEIFENKEIKGERSLQECLCDLLVQSSQGRGTPEAMLISTLPHSLHFPQNFFKPKFALKIQDAEEKKKFNFEVLIQEAMKMEKHRVWLLSSLPGSGKTTVMSEIALELRRRLSSVKVFKIGLLQDVLSLSLLPEKKVAPSLVTVISSATRVDEEEIENLIEEKKIILLFDGFDEICPVRRDAVLNLLEKAVEREIPIWISTRPHEEDAIRRKLGGGQKICTARILPLEEEQQIELLKMISKRDFGECKSLIANFQRNGSDDILSNPLHLKMIAQLDKSLLGNDSQNLFDIYENIVMQKVRHVLKEDYIEGKSEYLNHFEKCLSELQNIALSYLNNESVKELTYERNGIVTLIDGNIVFVHQTFAEFFAAQNYIDCLKEEKCINSKIPFDLLEQKYRQVRKFVEMKISEQDEETQKLRSSLELVLSENLTNNIIFEIFIGENLPTMFSLFENQISFSKNGSEVKFHFEDGYQILNKACCKSDGIAMKLLDLRAFESLEFSKINEITKILSGAIKNNFVCLFKALVKKCSTHSLIENCRANDDEMRDAVSDASENNYHEMLKLVIESGLIDMHGKVAIEALERAVNFNSVECVEILIQHGVPTECLDYGHWGVVSDYMEISTAQALLRTESEAPEELAIRLFGRAIEGESVEAAKYLQQKYRVLEKTVFNRGMSALHVATIMEGEEHSAALKMCRWLVEECDLKIGDKDDRGWNALHLAVEIGNSELVKYFLEKDPALIKFVNFQGLNLLQLECYWGGGKTIVEFIHSRDGDLIKQKTEEGKTALHFAAKNGNHELCVFLVDNGVDLKAVDDEGWNAAHCVAKNYKEEGGKILMYLHKEKPELIMQKTILGETMLHLACKNKEIDLETIKWLMTQGLNPRDVNSKGWNALHFAASEENIKTIKFIHEKCPGLIESLTNDGENAMHLMAKSGCYEDKLKELHSLCGKLVKQKTKTNKTMLHYAAQSNCDSKKKCEWLVEEIGMPIKSEDNDGWNVVHFAASKGNIEVITFIHEKCPNLIESATNDGENAMHLMAKSGCYEDKLKELHSLCGKLVKQKSKTNKTVLHYAAQCHYYAKRKCKWLVEEIGLQIEAEDDDGWSVVHFTANNDKYSIIELLDYIKTKNSGLILKTTKRKETALHITAMKGNFKAFMWLLKHNVDIRANNVDGKTALQVAHPQLVEYVHRILEECSRQPIDPICNTYC